MNWRSFEAGAPDIARQGRARLEQAGLALLGTIRADGSPRISPIEPFFLGEQLVIGVMESAKASDLERDPRVALHSSVTDVNGTGGELKLYGRAVVVTDPAITSAEDAWWSQYQTARVYALDIREAAWVSWDSRAGRMQILTWTSDGGVRRSDRSYP